MNCIKCGKDLKNWQNVDMVGIKMTFINASLKKEDEEDIKKQLGKYYDLWVDKSNGSFNFCWECWLDSLFGEKKIS